MQVKNMMQKELITLPISATIKEAARKMKENNVGSILIVEEDMKLSGIVTDRDIAMAVAVENKNPDEVCAYDFMTTDPVTIRTDDDINTALKAMSFANVRRLPVCENGKLTGMLSSADIAIEIKHEFDNFIDLEKAFAKTH